MPTANADQRLTLRLTTDARARLQSLAHGFALTESALVKRLIDRATEAVLLPPSDTTHHIRDAARAERLYVRLYPDDRQLLAERATARGMPSATYLAVLARTHLRQLAPLPEAELQMCRRCVGSLSVIGRNLNQVARRVNQDGVVSSITREDVATFIKICTLSLEHFRSLLKANRQSWEVGYETSDRR